MASLVAAISVLAERGKASTAAKAGQRNAGASRTKSGDVLVNSVPCPKVKRCLQTDPKWILVIAGQFHWSLAPPSRTAMAYFALRRPPRPAQAWPPPALRRALQTDPRRPPRHARMPIMQAVTSKVSPQRTVLRACRTVTHKGYNSTGARAARLAFRCQVEISDRIYRRLVAPRRAALTALAPPQEAPRAFTDRRISLRPCSPSTLNGDYRRNCSSTAAFGLPRLRCGRARHRPIAATCGLRCRRN